MVIIDGVAKLYLHLFFTIKNSRNILFVCILLAYSIFFIYFCRFFLINVYLLKLSYLTVPNKNEKIFLTNLLSCCVMDYDNGIACKSWRTQYNAA